MPTPSAAQDEIGQVKGGAREEKRPHCPLRLPDDRRDRGEQGDRRQERHRRGCFRITRTGDEKIPERMDACRGKRKAEG